MVEFFPQNTTMPGLTPAEKAAKAAQDLIKAIKSPGPATPFNVGQGQLETIDKLAAIFKQAATPKDTDTAPRVVPRQAPRVAPSLVLRA